MMHPRMGTTRELDRKDMIFEPKLDGYRAILTKDQSIRVKSRNNNDLSRRFPELLNIPIKAEQVILDGEIVIYGDDGIPRFSLVQNHEGEAVFVAFDILSLNGKDLRYLPLSERKSVLSSLEHGRGLQIAPYTSDGRRLWGLVQGKGLEGIIAKKERSRYIDGRSADWVKIKIERTADCIIIGYRSKKRTIASLTLGVLHNNKILEIGQVGTGFSEMLLSDLIKILKPRITSSSSSSISGSLHRLKPELICEVKYLELTSALKLRAPVFLRLRDDKRPEDCTLDQFSIAKQSL
jgi:bifunctional non-homologous end joining protein LigD